MEKIEKLKKIFIREKLDGYLIPKNDEFFDENIPEYNDRLNFISSFSGSYGFALILKNRNFLFIDGRYTLQANNQSGRLFKIIKAFDPELKKKAIKILLISLIIIPLEFLSIAAIIPLFSSIYHLTFSLVGFYILSSVNLHL